MTPATKCGVNIRTVRPTLHMQVIQEFYDSCGYRGPVRETDQIILASENDQIIGVVRLVEENGCHLLRGMFIRDDWHRRGIGTAMLKQFENLLSQNEVRSVFLTCGAHLMSFYGQIGFKKVSDSSEIPAFLVKRSAAYAREHGEQIIMQRTGGV